MSWGRSWSRKQVHEHKQKIEQKLEKRQQHDLEKKLEIRVRNKSGSSWVNEQGKEKEQEQGHAVTGAEEDWNRSRIKAGSRCKRS